MDKRRKLFVRVVAVILAVIMALSVLVSIIASTVGAAASKSALEELKKQREQIQQEMQEVQSEINSLQYEQSVAIAKKTVLDQQIELTQRGIDNLTEQIEQYGLLIEQKQEEVEQRQSEEEDQWELYKIRMRAMEENGTISYYAIIFGASDFADMLVRMDTVESIINYDQNLYKTMVAAREATEQAKVDLQATAEEMEEAKDELTVEEANLEEQLEEAAAVISELNLTIEEQQELYNTKSAEEDEIKDQIVKMEKELEEMAARTVTGTGSFSWPSAVSTRVTSGFGARNTGIPGASTNHKGIDIGASYGTDVLACDSGTVLTATYSSSYGYYVTISHGNGYTTLYAHMSRLGVSAGQTVSKGQTIGKVGATGIANGAHIHLEIWKNGVRVNPLNYFSNYTY